MTKRPKAIKSIRDIKPIPINSFEMNTIIETYIEKDEVVMRPPIILSVLSAMIKSHLLRKFFAKTFHK